MRKWKWKIYRCPECGEEVYATTTPSPISWPKSTHRCTKFEFVSLLSVSSSSKRSLKMSTATATKKDKVHGAVAAAMNVTKPTKKAASKNGKGPVALRTSKKGAKASTKKGSKVKKERQPRDPDALGVAQVRALKALAASKRPLSRKLLNEKAPIRFRQMGPAVGFVDADVNKQHPRNLVNRKFVRMIDDPEEGICYEITASGRNALKSV